MAGGSEPSSYTFSFSHIAELASGAILLYKGADPSDPIDVTGAAAGFSDSPTAPNVTTTVVFTTVLRIAGVDDDEFEEADDEDDGPYPPGLTGLFVMSAHFGIGPDPSLAAADFPPPAIGPTGTAAFALDDNEEWRAVTIAIKPVQEALDLTSPLVTITNPANGATFELNEVAAAGYTCTDTDSGIATCLGNVAVGAQIDTATLGTKTFTVTGTDNQGNVTGLDHSYTVADSIDPGVTITTPADGATFEMHEVVQADYACPTLAQASPPARGMSLAAPRSTHRP